jgi:putative peptidoglycan lipid II flippase
MTAGRATLERTPKDEPEVLVGGYAALAEGAWMGKAQATDVLEPLRALRWPRVVVSVPRVREVSLKGLLTRELTIAEATVILMASFLFSAFLGAVRQVLFNAQFGAGAEASAYYAAFRLPDMLFSLIAGGALSSAMIPVLLSTIQEEGEEAGWRLTSLVLNALLAVFAAIVLILEIFTPTFVNGLLAPGFDAETSALTVDLTRIMLLQTLILAVGSVATAVLNSRNQFLLTALSIMSHNVALIAGILASRAVPGLGIYGPTLGVVGGAALQVLILLPGIIGRGARYRPVFDPGDRRLREVTRLLIPNGLAVGVGYAGFILDTAFASKARESEALAAIQNAWLLVGLPIALLGQAAGQAAFPRLAAHVAAGNFARMRATLWQALAAVVALALPATAALIVLGRPTIQILFEHGKFDAVAGSLTYQVMTRYAIALPFYVGTEVVTRGLIALRDTRSPLMTNTLQLLGRAAIISLLLDDIGAAAIPISFAISASIETLLLTAILLVKLRRRLQTPAMP